jgi:5-(carboxyamino)imidazole ribonucleotide synthase
MGERPAAPAGAPVVGMIGGGQLARMTHQAAIALGVGFRVLAARPDDSAAQVVADTAIGEHDDPAAVLAFARGCDVITFDHEHVPASVLREVQEHGVDVRPSPDALVHAQDKAVMRQALTAMEAPVPAWEVVDSPREATLFAKHAGWPIVLKTSRGGYDGKGVWVAHDSVEVLDVMSRELPAGAVWLAEAFVPFDQELAAQVARSPHGQAVSYPIVRTVQTNGVCTEVIAPAPGLRAEESAAAQELALRISAELDVVGMLAVELFHTKDGILVNELAMRPHNSGHWSIEGATTSQFENHLRAVLDLPLGAPDPVAAHTVMVNVLGGDHPDLYAAYRHVLAREPRLHVHLYGKQVRRGRKQGHVTQLGSNLEHLLVQTHHAADYITGVIDE